MHSNQVAAWKKQAVEGMSESLSDGRKRAVQEEKAHEAKLYQQIGQLQFELDWLKKIWGVLIAGANWSNQATPICRSRGSATCWGCRVRVTTTRPAPPASGICGKCG